MIVDFVGFMSLAAVCFSGFLFTLYTMGKQTWKLKEIAWLLLYVCFVCRATSDLIRLFRQANLVYVQHAWLEQILVLYH